MPISSARELAACSIQAEPQKSKSPYDRNYHVSNEEYQVEDWVLVRSLMRKHRPKGSYQDHDMAGSYCVVKCQL